MMMATDFLLRRATDMAMHQLAPVLQHIRAIADPAPAGDLADGPLLARFAAAGNEAAFAELVRRHGPLVLGVCRRILGDVHAAEDAFQATFLLLVRKGDRLRRPDRLGSWLYGVARRVALRARTVADRRREVPAVDVAAVTPDDCPDLRPILDDAIARLPARDRTPVVLCYFQGLTYAEAARRLRCPPGTVSARLARARARLRALLTKRGVVPAAGAIAAALAPDSLAATVPVALRNAAVHYAAGAAIIPAGVLTLTKGVGHAMILDKIKLLAAVVMLGTASTGAWFYGPAAAQSPIKVPAAPLDQPVAREDPKPVGETSRFQTANFDVTAPTAEIARQVGEAAERERKAQAMLWLGEAMPPWPKRCPLTVKPTTGGSAGATKFNFDFRGNYEVLSMEFEGDLQRILRSVLPHEMTHTVFAHHFRYPVPRWADEGAAVAAESEDEHRHHDRLIRQYLDQQKALPLRRLFQLKDYGGSPDAMLVFTQGYSVTRYLLAAGDRPTFLRFIKLGMADGWDAAARACYNADSVEALQLNWMGYMWYTRDRRPPNPTAPLGPTDEPAPIPAVATLRTNGQINLAWSVRYRVDTRPISMMTDGRPIMAGGQTEASNEFEESVFADKARVVTPDGKPVDAKTLTERLQQPTVVLVAAHNRLPDLFHLQLLKADTLIFLSPEPMPAAPAPATPKK
jgi:RNA polymerase sigma factor (sigma-70 family)